MTDYKEKYQEAKRTIREQKKSHQKARKSRKGYVFLFREISQNLHKRFANFVIYYYLCMHKENNNTKKRMKDYLKQCINFKVNV